MRNIALAFVGFLVVCPTAAHASWFGHNLRSNKPFQMSCRGIKNPGNNYKNPANEFGWINVFRFETVVDPSNSNVTMRTIGPARRKRELDGQINFISPSVIEMSSEWKSQNGTFAMGARVNRETGDAYFSTFKEDKMWGLLYKDMYDNNKYERWQKERYIHMKCKYKTYQ